MRCRCGCRLIFGKSLFRMMGERDRCQSLELEFHTFR